MMFLVAMMPSRKDSGNATLLMVLAIVVLLAYLPMMVEHFKVLWELEQYQYFPFIIGAVGWLGWSRWQEASLAEDKSLPWYLNVWHHQLPVVWVLLSFVTLAVAVYCQWGWFAAVVAEPAHRCRPDGAFQILPHSKRVGNLGADVVDGAATY